MTLRLLASGGAGQLGKDLAACSSDACEVTALSRQELDIEDCDQVRERLEQVKPDVFVNCAAWTAVDACEADPDQADRINGHAVATLREECERVGVHLVQVSTDYVFDGSKQGAYLETDVPNPASAYGRSKLLGEANAGAQSAVVRTSWVYSQHGGNMAATICRLSQEHETLRFVSDQVGHPTYTADLAQAIINLAHSREPGIWHCTNAGAVSWHEFAQAILSASGADPARVLPIASAELDPPRPAPRPANSVLSNERYSASFAPLRDFRETLPEVVSAYLG